VEGLLALITAFPTMVFAALGVVCLAYWLLVLVGAADVDIAGGHDDVVDAVAGALKGVAGAAKGVAGAAKGGGGLVGEALASLGLSKVPITITLTMFSLSGFLLSTVATTALRGMLPSSVAAFVAFVVAAAGGLGAASLAARALARLFVDGTVEAGGDALVGTTCRITIAADDDGGQARVDEVIVAVRAVGQTIPAGEEAVIIDRADDGVFVVEPMRAHLPSEQDAFARLEASTASAVPAAPEQVHVAVAPLDPRKDTKA
jgi:hypothetical protein